MSNDDILWYGWQEKFIKYETKICECGYKANEEDFLAVHINLLKQYTFSQLSEDRFISSIGNGIIERAESIHGQTKEIEIDEVYAENFNYFFNNEELQEDFKERFCNELGEENFEKYINIITNYWYDGKRLRNDTSEIKSFKYSIYNYLNKNFKEFYCLSKEPEEIELMFESFQIEKILKINSDILDYAIDNWLGSHPKKDLFGTNDIYYRRGINNKFNRGVEQYNENDFINSYTLSSTVAEQFSQTGNNIRFIVSGEMGLFNNRILFFSPFLKGFQKQIEIGVIPHTQKLNIVFSNTIGEIDEYTIED